MARRNTSRTLARRHWLRLRPRAPPRLSRSLAVQAAAPVPAGAGSSMTPPGLSRPVPPPGCVPTRRVSSRASTSPACRRAAEPARWERRRRQAEHHPCIDSLVRASTVPHFARALLATVRVPCRRTAIRSGRRLWSDECRPLSGVANYQPSWILRGGLEGGTCPTNGTTKLSGSRLSLCGKRRWRLVTTRRRRSR